MWSVLTLRITQEDETGVELTGREKKASQRHTGELALL